jgi:hypothetical protein
MTKVLSWVFGVLLATALIFGGQTLYTKWQLQDAHDTLNEQLMEANLELGKAKTEFGNAQKHVSELQNELQSALKKNNELLTAYGELEAKYEIIAGGSGSDTIEPGELLEPGDKYKPGMWYIADSEIQLSEMKELKINYGDFRIDILTTTGPERWTTTDYRLHMKFTGQFVQSTTRTGAINYYFSLWEIDDEGNRVGELGLESFDVVVQKPKQKSMFWWAPHLDLGVFLGMNDKVSLFSGASIGFTTSGYGLTKNDLTWKFVRLGADFSSDTIGLSFSPAQYNLGEVLPLISNLFIGPYISAASNGTKGLGLNLTVGL